MPMTTAAIPHNAGKIVQIIGPVLDVEFEPEHLPEIYNALRIKGTHGRGAAIRVIAEVQQHIGRNQVRAVAMSSTDGVVRGMDVVDTGAPITRAGGRRGARPDPQRAGRAGGRRPADSRRRRAVADPPGDAPSSRTSSPRPKSSRPGIKVIDLIAPFVKGGKIGLFGGAGVGKTVIIRS